MAENNNTTIYTTKSTIDFGNRFKGKTIVSMLEIPGGRNYLIWMKSKNFKMSAQLFKKVEIIEKTNKARNGYSYEYDQCDQLDSKDRSGGFDDRDAGTGYLNDQMFDRGY